ncbi:serine endoprotease [Citrobacter amalonaticus]|nr:serine endoprotease [Citrobacter amalonaticus]
MPRSTTVTLVGALVNSLGELMGINTLSFDKSNDGETPEGIGFAIPFQLATKIMDKLIRDGRVIRGYIGIVVFVKLPHCTRRAAVWTKSRGSS